MIYIPFMHVSSRVLLYTQVNSLCQGEYVDSRPSSSRLGLSPLTSELNTYKDSGTLYMGTCIRLGLRLCLRRIFAM